MATKCERLNYTGLLAYYKITGEHISGPDPVSFASLAIKLADGTEKTIPFHRQSRPKFVEALLAQAKSAGVEVEFGVRVVDYFEDEGTGKAGVTLGDGTNFVADVVIAADGVGTKSTKLVHGHEIRAYPSGFSIFRTAFPIELAMSDLEVASRWPVLDGGDSYVEMWEGYVHPLVLSYEMSED